MIKLEEGCETVAVEAKIRSKDGRLTTTTTAHINLTTLLFVEVLPLLFLGETTLTCSSACTVPTREGDLVSFFRLENHFTMNSVTKQILKVFGARTAAPMRGFGTAPVAKQSFPHRTLQLWNSNNQPAASMWRPFSSLFTTQRAFSTAAAADAKQQVLSPTSPTMVTDSESGKEFGYSAISS